MADLYGSPTTATTSPAVTLRSVGSAGGQAAAFTYDLARSIVQTRQGNPAWAGQKRDGQIPPIRSDDLFFGAMPGDVQPDWVNLNKVAIPQADEQQRLLANLVTQMSSDRLPMPRFWYFPRGERAVVVMTGDDHTAGGNGGALRSLPRAQPGRLLGRGLGLRALNVLRLHDQRHDRRPGGGLPGAGLRDRPASRYRVARDFTEDSLRADWQVQLPDFLRGGRGSSRPPRTNRTHCIAWSDWASEPKVGREFGIRLDTNYYYWPGSWVQNRPGMFTGSGIPMRFADLDGSLIDVYQATTQITDESDMNIPAHIAALLDRALGPQGYYGAFTANMHTRPALTLGANAIVAAAQARGVPVISAEQLLDWIEGRNNSSFAGLSFDGSRLRFTLNQAAGARGLEAMVPAVAAGGRLSGLTRDGVPVATARAWSRGSSTWSSQPRRAPTSHVSARRRDGGGGTAPPVGGTAPPPERGDGGRPARPTGASAPPARARLSPRADQAAGELPGERAASAASICGCAAPTPRWLARNSKWRAARPGGSRCALTECTRRRLSRSGSLRAIGAGQRPATPPATGPRPAPPSAYSHPRGDDLAKRLAAGRTWKTTE